MNILLWAIFGAIGGWIASKIMATDASQGTVADILLGVVGAIVGGLILNFFGQPGVTGFNLYSLFVSVLGAVVVVYIGRLLHR